MLLKPKSQREQQEPSSCSRPSSSPRRSRTASKSSSSPTKNKKQQHCSSRTNNHLDMRYDDDEFAYTAHLVLQYMAEQHPDELLDIDDDAGCATFADVLQLWQCGEETSTSPSWRDQRDYFLTDDLLAEFQFALKHRLKSISLLSPSKNSCILPGRGERRRCQR